LQALAGYCSTHLFYFIVHKTASALKTLILLHLLFYLIAPKTTALYLIFYPIRSELGADLAGVHPPLVAVVGFGKANS